MEEHNYMASERESGLARNELLQYIQELGYDVDFKVSLAKLEKDDSGRITGIIAQNMDDDHFIRYNAAKGVLLACGGYAGNPYMMQQLDPLGTSVTTACSYSPADKGYGIRAAVWAGANLDKEAAPMLFDRGGLPWPPVWMPAMWTATPPLAQAALPGEIRQGSTPHPALPEGEPQRRAFCQRELPLRNDTVYAAVLPAGPCSRSGSVTPICWRIVQSRFHTIGWPAVPAKTLWRVWKRPCKC